MHLQETDVAAVLLTGPKPACAAFAALRPHYACTHTSLEAT